MHILNKKIYRPHSEVLEGVFIKLGLDNFDEELEKSKALLEVSLNGSFVSPRVVAYCHKDRSISFEYFHQLNSIRSVYINYMQSRSPSDTDFRILVDTGTVLAEIHEGLNIKKTVDWTPSKLFQRAFKQKTRTEIGDAMIMMPWSVAHCDFGFSNIHFLQQDDTRKLVIIDPSLNGFVTTKTNLRAPIYVDLANLVSCIHGMVPIRNYGSMQWNRLDHLINSIIGAYSEQSGHTINAIHLEGMVYATAKSYFNYAYRFPFSSIALCMLFTSLKRPKA